MLRAVSIVAAMFFLSGAAAAQTSPSAPAIAPAPAPSTAKIELTRKLMEVLRLKPMLKTMMKDLQPVLMEQEAKRHPDIPPEKREIIQSVVKEVLAEVTDAMLEKWVPIYASTFSDEEMRAIIEFYSSPVGQSYLDKTPQLSAAGANMVRDMMPEVQRNLVVRLCQRLDCFSEEPQPPAQQPS
jgi:hypothetical protein